MSGIAKLKAKSVWGAIRGLDTFSQLTFFTPDKKVNKFYILIIVCPITLTSYFYFKLAIRESIYVKDFPRFPYRGLLIDTARHFIPVPILKKQIDAMAYNKFNVFHW